MYTIPDVESNGLNEKHLAEAVSALVLHAALPGSEHWLALEQSAELLALQKGVLFCRQAKVFN